MQTKDKNMPRTETQILDSIISNRRSLIRLGGTALAGLALPESPTPPPSLTPTSSTSR
jgi:hypothetical protein